MEVFIVICEDRHFDAGISVHQTRAGADAKVEEFKEVYANRNYQWVERTYGRESGWLRYVDTIDDGPKARIEIGRLEP